MKPLLNMSAMALSLLITFIQPSFAQSATSGERAKELYLALDVVEQSRAAARTTLILVKKVGGLECIYTNNILSGDSYSCAFNSKLDGQSVFEALDVKEVDMDGQGEAYFKFAGPVVCLRDRETYSCAVER